MLRSLTLLLTVLTGASGLVYEVAWQKYLGTLLGSHSEATAAVLGLFLAGLSIGYAVFGWVSRQVVARAVAQRRPPLLLLSYGLAEIGIGLYALAFPWLFELVAGVSRGVGFESMAAGFAFDVALAAVLLLPPTILMGGTIPLLTQGLSRDPEDAARLHALVYAFNTTGAFGGALLAGFVLVPLLGLANTVLSTSAINLFAGAAFVLLGWRGDRGLALPEQTSHSARLPGFAQFCAIALLTGFAMMTLQTAFIRLGGLSFGASEYTFATVVSVFVLCIALGSFAVAALRHVPAAALAINQWLLAVGMLAVYFVLDDAPYWIHVLRTKFGSSGGDFYAYHLAGGAAFALLAGLPIALSGATLPLLFARMRQEVDELGTLAGHIYSWNTVGSLLGALLGGYALFFWLELHQVYRIAVAVLGVSAAIATLRAFPARGIAAPIGALALFAAALTSLVPWDPALLSTGLFRDREVFKYTDAGAEAAAYRQSFEIVYQVDDPTMTVTVRERRRPELERLLVTNGKGDGSTHADYGTMALAALIPALHTESPKSAFVIGLGTGVSAGEFAELESSERVVVAEISQGVIDAVRYFDFANFGVSNHPKIEIVRGDAYRSLLQTTERFDVIISEPSNPWVTGIEMLFSREFLEAARDRLQPGGVYAQWYHQYETNDAALELVLRTYTSVFDRVAVWYGWKQDLLLLGFDVRGTPATAADLERRASQPDYAAGLRRSRIEALPELLSHELLPTGVAHALELEGPLHELYHPRLSHLAGRAFFAGADGRLPFSGFGEAARIGRERSLVAQIRGPDGELSDRVYELIAAEACSERRIQCSSVLAEWYANIPESRALHRVLRSVDEHGRIFGDEEYENPYELLATLFDAGPPIPFGSLERATELYERYYLPAHPFSQDKLLAAWERCGNDDECVAGRERAHALFETGGRQASVGPSS